MAEWVIDVTFSSLDADMKTAKIYASANILEYWIFDLDSKQILVYQKPVNGIYSIEKKYSHDEVASLPLGITTGIRYSDIGS